MKYARNHVVVCFWFALAEINLLILDSGTVAAEKGLKFHFFFKLNQLIEYIETRQTRTYSIVVQK